MSENPLSEPMMNKSSPHLIDVGPGDHLCVVVVDDAVCRRNLYYEQSGMERDPGAQDETTQLEWMLRQVRDVGREEAKYRLALKAGRFGNWELDVRSDTSVRSLLHDQIFGYDESLADWGFEIFIEHVLPEDRAHVEQSFRAAIERGSTWNFEARIRRHGDGAVRWIEAHGHPYPEGSSGERVQYLLGIVADITERKELERALREADRHKDVFLATLAHELRNPLAPIINALQLIQQIGGPDHEFAALHAIMERQSTQLVRLLDDLVDISRISTGQLRLKFDPITLQTVLSAALEAAQPLIDAQKHGISVAMPQAPIHLNGDAARLTQVFQNVLNNAAKYTPSGGHIRLEIRLAAGRALISIYDTGAGISAELLPKIFDMFVQGHEAGARAHGGLGIGLPLARQLLDMHRGSIEARSNGPGHGSEFLISLPTAPPPRTSDDAAIEVAPEPRARRILIVDDNVDAADTLAQSLEHLGHAVAVRYDGASALSAVPGFAPDLVILDIGLPDLDGYDVAQQLRTQHVDLTLVALTGWGQPSDRERARVAGFDLHRTKPVDPRNLMSAVDALH
jgi:PAS domain S-box-containing protein